MSETSRLKPLSLAGSYVDLRHDMPYLGYKSSEAISPQPTGHLADGRFADRQSTYNTDHFAPGSHRFVVHGASWTQSYAPQSRPQSSYLAGRYDADDPDDLVARQVSAHQRSTSRSKSSDIIQHDHNYSDFASLSIPTAALHASITRICAEADLEVLTKRRVRQRLEQEFGVDLGLRKDEIGRMVEVIIAQDVSGHNGASRLRY
jgi:hypothetical protein